MSYIGKQPTKAALTASDIEDGIITAAKIEDGAVVAAEIASNAVTTAKINADAVTAAKIADNAISEEHLDATVVTGLTALEAEPADTDEFLVSDAGTLKRIDYSHIKGGVEDGAITKAKLADQVDIFSGTSLTAADLGAGIHIKTGDSGASPSAIADELVIENNDSAGLSILTSGGNAHIDFGDSSDNDIGRIQYNHSDNSLRTTVNAAECMRIDSSGNLKFNSGFGSLTTVYGVRVWVNFKGSDTFAIRDSGGVSSVTDNGVGSYTVNFSTNMPDTNFVTMTNPGPVISTGAKQFYFTSSSQPDAVGTTNIVSRSVDIDDNGFASADNDYISFIAIR